MRPNNGVLALQTRQRRIQRERRIKINLDKTQYPLIRSVAVGELGWSVSGREDQKTDTNLHWADTYVTEEFVRRLKFYQRVNHFASSQQLGNKNLLSQNLRQMGKIDPAEYDFYPRTWVLPDQQDKLLTHHRQSQNSNQKKWYITKPFDSSQGRGITITNQIYSCYREPTVVQQYISNPLLLEGLKFDLRIYVLLRSLSPLRIYKFEQGLVRLATRTYEQPNKANAGNLYMHLTNYAINKTNPCFLQNRSAEQDFYGHKRSMTSVLRSLQQLGCDTSKLQQQIDAVIVKTILSVYKKMLDSYKSTRSDQTQKQSVCFEILGFDILITSQFKPMLIEVNHSPSFCTQSPLDFFVKKYLIVDTLNCLNCSHEQKQFFLKNKPQSLRNKTKTKEDHIKQTSSMGAYKKIYPTSNEKINKLFSKITQKKPKSIRLRKFNIKQQAKVSNTHRQSRYRNRNHDFTLYGQLHSLKEQAKQMKSISDYDDDNIRRSTLAASGKHKIVQALKLKNIDISFHQEDNPKERGFFARNSFLGIRELSSRSQMSHSFSKEASTAQGRSRKSEVKKLDEQIRSCIGKMKLARIKLNRMKSLSRKEQEAFPSSFYTARMLKQQNIFTML